MGIAIEAEIDVLSAQLTALSERIGRVRDLVPAIRTGHARSDVLIYIADLEGKADVLRAQIAKLSKSA